ncbi:MAG: 16S rRNA (uracil(1498)-N(3))-methyltransferase [Clostridia bacterium]|nr:16S rRNA (uracil(1498)-N(3))-methyltransferase [Clostridia bacterium]
MPKFFVKENQVNNNKITILGTDVNHIKNVLRLQLNENIQICNSDNQENYLCKIKDISDEQIKCDVLEKIEETVEPVVKVTIFQGLPKSDKMELIIQKSVELGVYSIAPVDMGRCIVKLNEKDKLKKIDRWQKISEVAAKQCGRDIIPQISNVTTVKEICSTIDDYDMIIVAYEKEKQNVLKNELKEIKQKGFKKIGFVVGPEGGLEEKDVEMLKTSGAKIVTLGKRILRTETVALNVLSNIMYELEQ